MGIFHHADKMFQKEDFRVSNKEILLIVREYEKDEPEFLILPEDTRYCFEELGLKTESEIMKSELDDVPKDIRFFAAVRRSFSLLKLKYETRRGCEIMKQSGDYSRLNWGNSFVSVNPSFIIRCKNYAEKSRKNERERILFCLLMGIASIIGMRREWVTTNHALMKARMFGFESVSEFNKFMDCKTSPKWLKNLIKKYITRRMFDGLLREIKKRGWCKTIEGTPFRCTIVSITKFRSEFDDEINEFFFKKYGKIGVHL